MTMVSVPFLIPGNSKGFTTGSYTILDGANERIGQCAFFTTPDGGTRSITHICWSVLLATTGDDILCQLESVGADGLPAGVIAANASGTETVATSGVGYKETALTTPYTLTSGTFAACTFQMTNASKNIRIYKGADSVNGSWVTEDIAGGGTYANAAGSANVALKCSTGEYLVPVNIYESYSTVSVNNTSTPRYMGNKIVCGKKSRLVGFVLRSLDMDALVTIKLCDSSGATLKADDTTTDMSVSFDPDYRVGTASIAPTDPIFFPAPKSLTATFSYYLTISPDSSTNVVVNRYIYENETLKNLAINLPASGWNLNQFTAPGSGTTWDDPTDITETAAAYCMILPVFDQMDFVTDLPDVANVLTSDTVDGVAGTFDEAARNTDPGEAHVEDGVTYKIQNVAKEGSLVGGGGGGGGGLPVLGGSIVR